LPYNANIDANIDESANGNDEEIVTEIELPFNETQSIVSHETAGQMNANPIIAEFTRLR